MAMALTGAQNAWNPGLLLVGCGDAAPGSIRQLDALARAAFADRPRVRFGDQELAVLTTGATSDDARSQAKAFMATAMDAGMATWCGYAAWAAGTTAAGLIAAAEVSLAYARRSGQGTIIG
jgi:hypothetical protein